MVQAIANYSSTLDNSSMLTDLTVSNIALVSHLELNFDAGMSVITGETGAGKSLLLDALGLALGDRADSGLIGAGEDRAEIHATFDVAGNDNVSAWFAAHDIPADETCILRRVVNRDGRSRGYINGRPVTVTEMRELGEILIDIHSQHEHHSLLRRDTQRQLLDESGDLMAFANDVSETAARYLEKKHALDSLIAQSEEESARLQLLTYQAEELSQLGASENEADALAGEQKRLSNAESILSAASEALALCTENEDSNASGLLSRAIQLLSSIDVKEVRSITELLESAKIQVEEAAHDMQRFSESVELDPVRLQDVEARLSALYETARKHRVDPDELPRLAEEIGDELDRLSNADEEIEALGREVSDLRNSFDRHAKQLSKARRKAAQALTARVSAKLADLGMKGSVFDVQLSPREQSEPHAAGMEEVEFLISTNPGQPPRPLNRIASGGELSRISLAIQVVTANTSTTPTLVFDEVDVGIGGAVAEIVGILLQDLGERTQILCVTHLPQVAARGHHHLRVSKSSDDERATTEIESLDGEERIEEVARMLGGIDLTDQSLAHAKEMLKAS
jgi:DNA repair protein RecN (Recombination protein N)